MSTVYISSLLDILQCDVVFISDCYPHSRTLTYRSSTSWFAQLDKEYTSTVQGICLPKPGSAFLSDKIVRWYLQPNGLGNNNNCTLRTGKCIYNCRHSKLAYVTYSVCRCSMRNVERVHRTRYELTTNGAFHLEKKRHFWPALCSWNTLIGQPTCFNTILTFLSIYLKSSALLQTNRDNTIMKSSTPYSTVWGAIIRSPKYNLYQFSLV